MTRRRNGNVPEQYEVAPQYGVRNGGLARPSPRPKPMPDEPPRPSAPAHSSAPMRIAPLLSETKAAISSFLSSNKPFRIVRSVPASSNHSASAPPKTLFILDSSFNPPQIAHLVLATTALASQDLSRYPKPHRLLLLFSTHNADKAGNAPAAFEHRLAMMALFAQDLVDRMKNYHSQSSKQNEEDFVQDLVIDVGLTNKPYYNDKSAAIDATEPPVYSSMPMHIHLTGFDTYTRIFTPKYYPNHTPPLSALAPFFEKHGLRVTIRADEEQGKDERGEWGTAEEQQEVVEKLGKGLLEDHGGKTEWARRVEWVGQEDEGEGVSSTRIRKAVKADRWDEVERLCTPRVVEWIREEGLYAEEKRGEQTRESKMA